ncbi:CEP76 C2 domain-containing protein [Polychytrium aggregatum]|uniref:CEP76 C2 domain-containing protein n=1 Tax=Polychytrium aggregatum TaxID=110093 RepID=UPI0022FF00D5|nr:CEP76 C2 domain-containing protein [Polychytrium aggregatum]XP_052962231.1 CEP76 C2 domain-containing protein [Polychytrium aggregatum]KAI9193282.1 CEP76 C2 domain-containing protein [Polychytrium aggregatum]KAI9193293.1 CEP76 C2 domain-containing protein [Polychytrium aggregatum]
MQMARYCRRIAAGLPPDCRPGCRQARLQCCEIVSLAGLGFVFASALVEPMSALDEYESDRNIQESIAASGLIEDVYERVSKELRQSLSDPVRALGSADAMEQEACIAVGRDHGGRAKVPATATKPGCRYLRIELGQGRAFLGLEEIQEESTWLSLDVQFRAQRLSTSLVPSTTDPRFSESWMIELPQADLQSISSIGDRLHFVAIRSDGHFTRSVIGSAVVEWREVLVADKVSAFAELREVGNSQLTAGLVELTLELFPKPTQFLDRDELEFLIKREERAITDTARLFHLYAKQWWSDFLQIRSTHANRLVKIFALDEQGHRSPVTGYIYPIEADSIESPRHALRFVSLIPYHKIKPVGEPNADIWQSLHTFLCAGHGDAHDHSILLCNLLLGFSLDAYVACGVGRDGTATCWVVTIDVSGDVHIWDPLRGIRYKPNDPHPYRNIGCLFNGETLLANIQSCDSVDRCSFNLADPSQWKMVSAESLRSMRIAATPGFGLSLRPCPSSWCSRQTELEIADQIKQYISEFRQDRDMCCIWDVHLGHLLRQCLSGYELQKLYFSSGGTGQSECDLVGRGYFEAGVRRSIPDGSTFKAFPCQFNHLDPPKLFNGLLKAAAARDLIATRADKVRFGLQCKVIPYAETACSIWIMIAVKYQSVAL